MDQTETPEMLKEANANLAKGQKKRQAVQRELSSVLTPGTLVDEEILGSADANYTLSYAEQAISPNEIEAARVRYEQALASGVATQAELSQLEDESAAVVSIGFAWVDCTTGRFNIGQHRDDLQRSFLRTMLGFVAPREVILPRGRLTQETEFVFKHELRPDVIRNETIFPTMKKTIDFIHQHEYYAEAKVKAEMKSAPSAPSISTWPSVLQQLIGEECSDALSAFGALAEYLKRTLHDFELLSQRHVNRYYGPYSSDSGSATRVLALDAQTLANLDVVKNKHGKIDGTLLEFVDRTKTPFGRRMIKDWLMKPLLDISAIQHRQDAVQFFMTNTDFAELLRRELSRLPDLERHLSRVHANGLKRKVEAIFYSDVGAKQLQVFLKTLDGFTAVGKMLQRFDEIDRTLPGMEKGSRLHSLITPQKLGGRIPNFLPVLAEIRQLFDVKLAVSEGKIKPSLGLNPDYDQCLQEIDEAQHALDQYLRAQQQKFGASVKWVHKNKERFQLEVPINMTNRVNDTYQLVSSNKQCKRYWTNDSRRLAATFAQLELAKEAYEKDMARTVFARFAEQYAIWITVVDIVGEIDCLLSLAHISLNHLGCVRPEFVDFNINGSRAMLNLRQASHPGLYEKEVQNRVQRVANFVPNDTVIGCEENPARFVLVSGANMGGKSTLLRQTCCAVILAQMGAWVPAERCQLTPVDRIFTRVGANDKLMQGQSTFFVELMETSHILNHATNRSLVILDELGTKPFTRTTGDNINVDRAVTIIRDLIISFIFLFSNLFSSLLLSP